MLTACTEPALVLRYANAELTIVGCNPQWVELCGHGTRDLMRRTPNVCMSATLVADIATRLAGDDLATIESLERDNDHLVGSHPVSCTLTLFEPDGSQRFVLLTAIATAAVEEEISYPEILDAMAEAVVMIDRGYRVRFANGAITALTGWTPTDLMGAPLPRLTEGEWQTEFTALLAKTTTTPSSTRLQIVHRKGRTVHVEASATLLDTADGGIVVGLRDLTSQQEHEQALAGMSAVDILTGLSNRQAFVDKVAAIANSSEPKELVVAFLDLDNFKTINDALGHDQGDLVLKTMAQRLTHAIGSRGIVARFGGDEFVIAAEQPQGTGHDELVYLLGAAFADPVALHGKEFQVTVSIGITTTCDPEQMQPEAVLKAADTAMYEAKRRGKDRVAVYDESLENRAAARLETETDLRQALERNEFVLFYQPIIDVVTGRTVGSEALIRWIHPERGMVPPDQFIPIAEETGLIVPIGAWVLDTAVAQTAAWNETRLTRRALGVSVNLSGLQLGDPDLERHIHATLSRHGFDPARLTLEVTESTLMTDSDGAMAILERLRDLGIRIAIDDFGTGYSSLAYLKRLPAGALKIDKAFIDGLGTNAEDTSLVTGIIGLASALDLELVAEGVEGEVQLKELRRLGCEYSQGYFHSRPLPPDDFVEWISERSPTPPRGARLPEVPPTAIAPAPVPTPVPTSFVDEAEVWELPRHRPRVESGLFDQDAG